MRRDGIILTTLIVAAAILIGRSLLATSPPMVITPSGLPVVTLMPEAAVPQLIRFGSLGGTTDGWFRLALANPTDRSVRILGYDAACGPVGCVHIEGIPAAVPAGGSLMLDYWVELTPRAGHLHVDGALYTDSVAKPTIPIVVEGDILDGRKRSD